MAMGAVLGGEDSGHVIFLDHHTTGDGILTALQLVAAMLKDGRPLSEMAATAMDVFPQRLINVKVARKPDLSEVPEIVEAVAAAEAALGDQGRVLVRYSGTENLCRVMVEGPTAEITEKWATELAEVVRVALGG
jgi:phosphoglucosamine mutase